MAYSKTLEFGGSHFQTKSAKFPWDPGNSRKQQISGRALTGLPLKRHISIWVQSAELISSGASTTRIFETSKKHLGVLCEIMLWKLLLFVLGSPEGRPSRLQTLTKTKTLKSARDAVTSDERKHKWKHMKCIA